MSRYMKTVPVWAFQLGTQVKRSQSFVETIKSGCWIPNPIEISSWFYGIWPQPRFRKMMQPKGGPSSSTNTWHCVRMCLCAVCLPTSPMFIYTYYICYICTYMFVPWHGTCIHIRYRNNSTVTQYHRTSSACSGAFHSPCSAFSPWPSPWADFRDQLRLLSSIFH